MGESALDHISIGGLYFLTWVHRLIPLLRKPCAMKSPRGEGFILRKQLVMGKIYL